MGDIDISQKAVDEIVSQCGKGALWAADKDHGSVMEALDKAADTLTALRAALDAAEARAVGVRPLVWEGREDDCYVHSDVRPMSYELLVSDMLERRGDYVWTATYNDGRKPNIVLGSGSFLEAQAAAQSDYTARILSALHPASPLGAVAMREKAAGLMDMHNGVPCQPPDRWPKRDADLYVSAQMGASDSHKYAIRALPTTFTDAELLAAAAEVILQHALREPKEDKEDPLIAGAVIPWLQDLAAMDLKKLQEGKT